MSRRTTCNLVALLEHDERAMWSVVERAIDLAEVKRGPLTLAASAGPGRLGNWLGSLALLSRTAPVADVELRTQAADRLAKAAEFIPASIPVTTLQLNTGPIGAVRQLGQSGAYDLLVISHRLITRSRRIRRELRRTGLSVLIACPEPVSEPGRPRRRSRSELVG